VSGDDTISMIQQNTKGSYFFLSLYSMVLEKFSALKESFCYAKERGGMYLPEV
jgi:hypothetical protein